jgi:hypothetical protein
MHQGEVVKNLNRRGLAEDLFWIIAIESIREHTEQRADSFSAQAQDVGDWIV